MELEQKSAGLAFNIVFDEEVAKRPPGSLSLFKNKQDGKKPLTLDEINEKQLLAKRRRQERMEARLKRMQEREESTRKLAERVDVLLQQQTLRTGKRDGQLAAMVPKMSPGEIRKTAHEVAIRFKEMQQQLLTMDLRVDCTMSQMSDRKAIAGDKVNMVNNAERRDAKQDNVKNVNVKNLSTVEKGALDPNDDDKNECKAFEIPINNAKITGKGKKRCPITSLQAKDRTSSRKLTAEELDEKQQKAAERRQKRKEEKVRKTKKGRESLMELQRKVNIYVQHEEAVKGEADQEKVLSDQNAACLAREIAEGFSNIRSRYRTDLERAKGFFMSNY